MRTHRSLWRQPLAVSVLLFLLFPASLPAASPPAEILGVVDALAGAVRINGATLLPQTMVLPGDRIRTEAGGGALVRLERAGQVSVDSATDVTLNRKGGRVELSLAKGRVLVRPVKGRQMLVNVAGMQVQVLPGAGAAGLCEVVARGESTSVFCTEGEARILSAENRAPVIVPAGYRAITPATAYQAASGVGEVGAVRGSVSLLRGGQEFTPGIGTAVQSGDVLQVGGSIRLVLSGGSVVSVGSGSELRIGRHDTGSGSDWNLSRGKMRVTVRGMRGSAQLQIQTANALLTAAVADFFVEFDGTCTEALVFDGTIAAQPVRAAAQIPVSVSIGGQVRICGDDQLAVGTFSRGAAQAAARATESVPPAISAQTGGGGLSPGIIVAIAGGAAAAAIIPLASGGNGTVSPSVP